MDISGFSLTVVISELLLTSIIEPIGSSWAYSQSPNPTQYLASPTQSGRKFTGLARPIPYPSDSLTSPTVTAEDFRSGGSGPKIGRIPPGVRHLSQTIITKNMEKKRSNEEWQAVLTPEQFRVLREKGTEPANSGEYNKFNGKGVYSCAACNTPLYVSDTKFDSGCGWPAFFDAIPGAINRKTDNSHGMSRIEITCAACDGHLGHVFKGEGWNFTSADERHCVNSVSIKFKEEGKSEKS
ncbi:7620_t:CDS:2 [Diversispora eburnea]|uniref:Peptide-methionine (R)-S-oxide reductase n=1 Tax=Diversispora eburnea TaxID=1213867 RepID=A0A9N8ZT03_9GLOM|nr:7620_t:CDS:2 [Diversispora eburnea]